MNALAASNKTDSFIGYPNFFLLALVSENGFIFVLYTAKIVLDLFFPLNCFNCT